MAVRKAKRPTYAEARAACIEMGMQPSRSIDACLSRVANRKRLLATKVKPDWRDPFAPKRGGTRQVRCIHCWAEYRETEVVYERRFGRPLALWWCKAPTCDGAGIGFDIHPVGPAPQPQGE